MCLGTANGKPSPEPTIRGRHLCSHLCTWVKDFSVSGLCHCGGRGDRGGAGRGSPWSQTTPLLPAIPSQIRPSLPVPGVQTKAGGLQRSLPKQPAGRAIGVAATGLGPGLARSGLESPGPHCIFSVTPRARQSARARPVAPCTPTCVPTASPCPRGAICAVVVTAAPPSWGCCEDDVSCNR